MILKGSQRSGAIQLATHLLNEAENDHVHVHELRGVISSDLKGALNEMHAVSKGTKCRQFMFSLSLNPPKDAACSLDDLVDAANRAEKALGLEGQPRAIVVHEKQGRRHIHAVWSRIDLNDMTAKQMSFFKNRLSELSKQLYLDHGWDLPEGHRENGWKNPLNFTHAEWQQAKRLDLHPSELKQLFRGAWRQSDDRKSFAAALEEHGYYLARGDRRGFVAVDHQGEVFSISRMTGEKTKDITLRLGSPDGLPSVEDTIQRNKSLMTDRIQSIVDAHRQRHAEELGTLQSERREIVFLQRCERKAMSDRQLERWSEESADRQARFRRGIRGLWDILTGRAAKQRAENEREVLAGRRRDQGEREQLYEEQSSARRGIIDRIAERRQEQRAERTEFAGQVAYLLKLEKMKHASPDERKPRQHSMTLH